jgi:hypothetical protein
LTTSDCFFASAPLRTSDCSLDDLLGWCLVLVSSCGI